MVKHSPARNRTIFRPDGTAYVPDVAAKHLAAENSRRTASLFSTLRTPVEELDGSALDRLRARSRFVCNNFPQAAGIVNVVQNRLFGAGIDIEPKMRDAGTGEYLDAENKQLRTILREIHRSSPLEPWTGFLSDGSSLRQACKILARSIVVEGGFLMRRGINPDPRRVISREWQLLDLDQLASSYSTNSFQGVGLGNQVVQGVEINGAGRPVAYHLYENGGTIWRRTTGKTVRVPASEIIHFFVKQRPGQVREIPMIATIIISLLECEEFTQAKIEAEFVANAFAGFETRDFLAEDEVYETVDGQRDISSMSIVQATPGYKMEFSNPNRPGGQLGEFLSSYNHSQAVAMGFAYAEYTGDGSKENYGSMRGLQQMSEVTHRGLQCDVDDGWLDPIYRDEIDMIFDVHRLMAEPNTANRYEKWVPWPMVQWLDILDEVKRDIERINNGLTSPQRVCAKDGVDSTEVIAELASWQKQIEDSGVILGVDKKAANATVQGADESAAPETPAQRRERQNKGRQGAQIYEVVSAS